MTLGRVLALTVIAGTTVGATTSVGASAAYALSLAALSLALIVEQPSSRRALVAGCLGAIGVGHAAAARDRVLAPPLVAWLDEAANGQDRPPSPVVVHGTLIRDAAPVDKGARLLVDVVGVEDHSGRRPIQGRVQAFVAGDFVPAFLAEWSAGRPVSAPMSLRRPPVSLNPGGPSARWQTLRRQFDLAGSIKSATLVNVTRGRWWEEAAASVRAGVRRSATGLFQPGAADTAAIVIAILIGDRAGLDDELERRLQMAGTYHVIAISGGNVALIAGLSFILLRLLMRSARWASLATIVVITSYGWIVGSEPSVSRAVTAAAIYLACGVVGLVPAALEVLALVAVLVLINAPLTVVDAGAWLSFGATLGIIVCARRVIGWRRSRPPAEPSLHHRVIVFLTGLFGATLAAELILWPVNAVLFSRVGVAGLVLNFVAIPMIAVVQVAGAAAVALAGWWEQGATIAAAFARVATAALVGSSRLVDVIPWLSWRVPPPSIYAIVAFYATGAIWLGWPRRTGPHVGVAAAFVLCAVVVGFAPVTWLALPASGMLRFTMMDVGQGEALLLQFPTGQSLLVDAGGSTARFDVGDRLVAPALWAQGVRRLDWLAFTHPDLDHIGGSAAIVGVLRPREVWEGTPVPPDSKRRLLKSLVAARGAVWRQLQRGDRFEIGAVDVDVQNPPVPEWERQRVRNEDSIVVRVRYRDVELLLTGDIAGETEQLLTSQQARRPVRVLKVAHHGSRSSSSMDFLRRYAPHVALVSAGRGNPFGHPSPDVLQRLADVDAQVFRTDVDGAIVIETDGRALVVRSMTGRIWTMRVWGTA